MADAEDPSSLVRLGDVLRRARRAAGLSQEALASRLGYTRPYVSQVETASRWPGAEFVRRCDHNLGTDLLALYEAARRRRIEERVSASGTHPPSGQTCGASVQGSTREADSWLPQLPLHAAGAVEHGGDGARSVEAVTIAFRAADAQVGGAHLYRTVSYYLGTEVAPRMLTPDDDRRGARVMVAAASLTEMIGWMAHDSGNDALARRHYGQALRLARAVDETSLSAQVLGSMSHLAGHTGNPEDALRLSDRAFVVLRPRRRHAVLQARLHALRARALATLGRVAECTAALRKAHDALEGETAGRSPTWLSPFDDGSLASVTGSCLRDIGQLKDGARQAETVVRLRRHRARSRALGQLLLASIHWRRGDIDGAAAAGLLVLATLQTVPSAPAAAKLDRLAAALAPHRGNRAVEGFLGEFREMRGAGPPPGPTTVG